VEEQPEIVLRVHKGYLAAGADIILTNSFGANRYKLGKYGLAQRAAALAEKAAILARGAGEKAVVLGSIGPTGALLRPFGKLTLAEAQEIYAEAAVALARGGVDAIHLETFFFLGELEAALLGVLAATELPISCSMTFEKKGATIMGNPVEAFAVEIEALGEGRVVMLGVNCGTGPVEAEYLVERLCAATQLPVLVKPNAGQPKLVGNRTVYDVSPEAFAASARRWLQAGAKVVGGCCGTTDAHIRALAEVVKEWKKTN
jgi:5-methyltetrahydrofolate--homocysteine methyltransferase